MIIGSQFDLGHAQKGFYQKEIAALIESSGASDRIHLIGHVQKIEDYYRASDIFVFPTLKEGVPNVVIEAMASGLPVILTPFPTLPKHFGRPGQEYVLVDRNPEVLSLQMERLVKDAEIRKKLGVQGQKWVHESMDVEKTIDRYVAMYRSIREEGTC
jgi:glycosyltransferase involved in cell wall biosynthesis